MMSTNSVSEETSTLTFDFNGSNSSSQPTNGKCDSVIYVTHLWLVGIICLLGLTGNILSFVVLRRTFGSRSPMFIVLRALSVSDSVFLLVALIVFSVLIVYPCTGLLQTIYFYRGYIMYILWPLGTATQMTTVWLMVLVSGERYVAICRPLHVATVCTVSRVRLAVITIFVVSAAFNVPRYFDARVVGDGTEYYYVRTELGNSAVYLYTYHCAMYALIVFILPLFLLVFFNVRLVLALHKGRREWRHLQVEQRREQCLTLMLQLIVLVFFVCGIPPMLFNIFNILHSLAPRFGPRTVGLLHGVATVLVVVNSASNFFIYCLVGKKFRAKLVETLSCKKSSGQGFSGLSVKRGSSRTAVPQKLLNGGTQI